MTPGRPQQLPYVSPPDKKTSQEKSGSNIVVEKFQRIIGMCNAVIMVLKED